ncbi:hypothetical protein [Microbacterium sp. NPDC089695]|uniref:hypothetical protein n=1 Tax=Microbacterium sp. NPDC089695 TaxID=3364198 RepID=UPI00380CE9C4
MMGSYTDVWGTVTTPTYDPASGRVTQISTTPEGGAASVTAYSYDADGKVLTVSVDGNQLAGVTYDAVQERAQLCRDLTVQEQYTNHWYLKATYTPAELQVMYTRRSKGKNEFTGAWLTPDEQAAYDAMNALATVDDQAPVVHLEQHRAA